MPETIIAGNWKMHGDKAFVDTLLNSLKHCHQDAHADCLCLVLPPAIFLPMAEQCLAETAIAWGGQDVSTANEGAFTGEISAAMLKDFGCTYGLVGHSERRQYHQENNELVAKKFLALQQQGITPILCVGESLAEREASQTEAVIAQQLTVVIEQLGVRAFANAVVAYEPVWAIGTGKAATPEMAEAVHGLIRQVVAEADADIASQLSILYGGSVKPDNAAALLSQANINGALVGGASLQADSFWQICLSASSS